MGKDLADITIYRKLRSTTHVHYQEQVNQGYEWATNTERSYVEDDVKFLEGKGLECFVGDVSFNVFGNRIKEGVAILTRKRK